MVAFQYLKLLPEHKTNLNVLNYISTEILRCLFSHPAPSPCSEHYRHIPR